jgi:hypothetical protein
MISFFFSLAPAHEEADRVGSLRLCGPWRLCAELWFPMLRKRKRRVQRKDAKDREDAKECRLSSAL